MIEDVIKALLNERISIKEILDAVVRTEELKASMLDNDSGFSSQINRASHIATAEIIKKALDEIRQSDQDLALEISAWTD